MMSSELRRRLLLYQVTTMFGIAFAFVGFSYNVWRMEVTEENNNIRTACFEIVTELAALEQVLYAAHYDHDPNQGSPRIAWVKVGLIRDLSTLTAAPVAVRADDLHRMWSANWHAVMQHEKALADVIAAIDAVREEIKILLQALR